MGKGNWGYCSEECLPAPDTRSDFVIRDISPIIESTIGTPITVTESVTATSTERPLIEQKMRSILVKQSNHTSIGNF